MMLLVTNEIYEREKLDSLIRDLNVKGVMVANNLVEAKNTIDLQTKNINLIIISSVVVDDMRYTLKEIGTFSKFFSGPILAKVEDEKFGMELMKEGLVNDFYVSSSDKNLEFERLKKAFRVATLRSRVSNTISEIKDSIATLDKAINITKDDVIDRANKDNIRLGVEIAVNNEKIKTAINEKINKE